MLLRAYHGLSCFDLKILFYTNSLTISILYTKVGGSEINMKFHLQDIEFWKPVLLAVLDERFLSKRR